MLFRGTGQYCLMTQGMAREMCETKHFARSWEFGFVFNLGLGDFTAVKGSFIVWIVLLWGTLRWNGAKSGVASSKVKL